MWHTSIPAVSPLVKFTDRHDIDSEMEQKVWLSGIVQALLTAGSDTHLNHFL